MSIFSPARNIPAHLMLPRLVVVVVTVALTLLGLIMIYSAGSIEAISNGWSGTYYLTRQLIIAAGGFGGLLVLWKIVPFQLWSSKIVYLVWAGCLAVLILTAAAGYAALGATRWVTIFGFRFQPSEFVKIMVVLVMAGIIDEFRRGDLSVSQMVVKTLIMVGLPMAFILVAQSDLGTTAICAVAILAVMWLGEVRSRTVIAVVLIAAALCVFAIVLAPYRFARLAYFLNPWEDGKGGGGAGYQLIHSFYAFSEGGLFGVGIGNSAEKFLYLPEAETDFIFAIIGEELGLVGALLVIALFIAFLWAGLRIAQSAPTPFSAMVAGGLTVMIVFQAFLNIGCVVGIFPTTGKPLPFISYGGSSLLSSLLMVGFILSVSDESAGANVFDRSNSGGFEVIRGGRK